MVIRVQVTSIERKYGVVIISYLINSDEIEPIEKKLYLPDDEFIELVSEEKLKNYFKDVAKDEVGYILRIKKKNALINAKIHKLKNLKTEFIYDKKKDEII